MHFPLVALAALAIAISSTGALPQGAPTSICDSLLPSHSGIPARQTPSPFQIVSVASGVHQNDQLPVRIVSNPPETMFGGFMLHAVSPSTGEVIGHFLAAADAQGIECGSPNSTVTHTSPAPKSSGMTFQWVAPASYLGEIVFRATVAQQYDVFWVGIESERVQVVRPGDALPPPSTGGADGRPPVTPTSPPFEEPVKETQTSNDPIYDGCGDTKECVGFPDGCIRSRSCDSLGVLRIRGDRYIFDIKTWHATAAYVALGLSSDERMGDDAVIECVPEQGVIRAYTSWTSGAPNFGASREDVPQNSINMLEANYVNGSIYCSVERDAVSTVRGTSIDLLKNKYRLLLATGSSLKSAGIGYHDLNRTVSGDRNVLLLRLHAALMLLAWIGTASAGMLLARYYKQTWVGSTLCGKDQWFAWHRSLMVLTWVLTLAGFIVIFVELGAWSGEQNPHAILGTVTTILCFIQPFGALFRPAPTHRNRPIFNWMHWLVGNLAHILAIVAIFFAVKLKKAELPEWYDWILVAFVAFHILVHIILSISNFISDRSQSQRINTFQMGDIAPNRNSAGDRKLDAPYGCFRKFLLAIYLIILVLFVVALIVIATLAPIQQTFNAVRTQLMN